MKQGFVSEGEELQLEEEKDKRGNEGERERERERTAERQHSPHIRRSDKDLGRRV